MIKSHLSPRHMLAIAATLCVAPFVQAERCTVAVISDTQNYVDASFPQPNGADTVLQQMQYIADTKAAKNTVFATHVGDVVQHGDGRFSTGSGASITYWDTQFEWQTMDTAFNKLTTAGIPFGLGLGNHDFDNYSWYVTGAGGLPGPGLSRPLAGSNAFVRYFGPDSRHFAGKPWYGAGPEGNSYQRFSCGSLKLINLSLEHEPRTAVLQWAQGVIDANPGVPTIITTHEWIDPNFAGAVVRSNDKGTYFAGTSHTTPDKVWETFVYKNNQIFLTISGHDFTSTPGQSGVSNGQVRRVDKNKAGNDVHQLVNDYQGNTVGLNGPGSDNGGGGWMRFMEFNTDTRQIFVYTYSTLLNKYAGRNGENTFGTAPDFSEFYLAFPGQLTAALMVEPNAATSRKQVESK